MITLACSNEVLSEFFNLTRIEGTKIQLPQLVLFLPDFESLFFHFPVYQTLFLLVSLTKHFVYLPSGLCFIPNSIFPQHKSCDQDLCRCNSQADDMDTPHAKFFMLTPLSPVLMFTQEKKEALLQNILL